GSVTLPGGWRLRVELVGDLESARAEASINADPYRAWITFHQRGPAQFRVRARRPGDRFFPMGLSNHKIKLSDFMINEKIPRRARAAWPLVCVGNEIAWLPGMRLAETFRLTGETKRAVHLRLSRE
ncbi:MAG: tRNA lysidine(34) synthetase TilS, partial [Chloroflexota bacterium]|nr:tRNA lysidine(34) synthetase TilS [Chloroflexota bacterium]